MAAVEQLVRVARARLRGHVVATPVLGGIRVPGSGWPEALRLKLETLQPGGAIWFRGAMHYLACQLGALKGVVVSGRPRFVVAAVHAAALQRVPCRVVVPAGVARQVRALIEPGWAEVEAVPQEAEVPHRVAALQRTEGLRLLPGIDDEAFALGLATVGQELGEELPSDVDAVCVSPPELSTPLRAGLVAAGRELVVEGAAPATSCEVGDLAERVRGALRLDCDPALLMGAVDAAARHRAACIVLAE
jgi:threonine dehydratase